MVVGEVRRATAGLGSRWAHVICDLASRPGWWVVRYTTQWVGGVSHGLTDDLTSPIVSYSHVNSGCEEGVGTVRDTLFVRESHEEESDIFQTTSLVVRGLGRAFLCLSVRVIASSARLPCSRARRGAHCLCLALSSPEVS